jgi:hypothetical protein
VQFRQSPDSIMSHLCPLFSTDAREMRLHHDAAV